MVKKKCTVDAGIPSQVVTATVLSKPKGLMSVATKVSKKRSLSPENKSCIRFFYPTYYL